MIFDGTLRHGDHVRQDEIAEELGVSRIPVREAIIALDGEGWLSVEPHRGAFVHGLDDNSVRDHYALLGLLYGLAAQRATVRGGSEGVARLVEAERVLHSAAEPDAVFHANEAYLRQIFAMAESQRLVSFSRLMTGVIPGNFFERVPGAIEIQKQGIGAVNLAIVDRDRERAFAECVTLLNDHGDLVVQLLKARGVLWPPSD